MHSESRSGDLSCRPSESDELLEILADPRRRRALSCLSRRQTPVSREELAAAIADVEAEREGRAVGPSPERQIEIALHHAHLPRLEDAGLIERSDDGIRLAGEAPPIAPLSD